MPRNLHKYDRKYKLLGKFGIQRNNAIALLYCMNILGTARRQLPAANLSEPYMEYIADENNANTQREANELSREELENRLSEQNSEIQKLRSALHTAEKELTDAQKKHKAEKDYFELERRELADLREILFTQDDHDETEDEEIDTAIFPYEVRKDTVVFGGHFTWSKAFRPLVKGSIRFVEKAAVFDAVIIRNCDVVWIQNNAIPHSQYYKIVNTARQYKKPVRYFRYASAVKCAKQLAESDEED